MRKKDLIAILVLFVLMGGLAVGLILVRQIQEIRERAQLVSDVSISVSPPTQTIAPGQKTTISLVLTNTTSPGRDVSLYAAEADLQFDPTYFTVSNLTCNGSFLSSAAVATVSGDKISLSCFAPGGSGTRTITAGSQATLGSFDITALDKTGASQISITRANVPDATTFADLSGGTGVGGSYTIAAVGGPQPTQTPALGQPNSCGGTCGSDANCQSGLFCYLGLCRSPSCPSSSSCSCVSATSTPTAKPKPKGKATATPTAIAIPTATPSFIALVESPTPTEIAEAIPTPQPEPAKGPSPIFLAGIGVGIFLFLLALLAVFRGGGKGGNPPTTTVTPSGPFPPQPPVAPPPV